MTKLILDLPAHMNSQLTELAKQRGLTKSALTRWALGDLFKKEMEDDRARAY